MKTSIVHRSLVFFFKVHFIALFYAFLIVPLAILGGFVGLFISYPFILLALFAPIGPISFALEGIYLYTLLPPEFSSSYNPPLIIIIVIGFKFFIYVYLRRTKIANYPTPLILSIATLITCAIPILFWWRIVGFVAGLLITSLVVTISMDLVVFSYVKYRDALNGMASREWILVLPILWALMIWSPMIHSREWLDWMEHMFSPIPITTIIAVWTTITVVQLALAIKYYKSTIKETLIM